MGLKKETTPKSLTSSSCVCPGIMFLSETFKHCWLVSYPSFRPERKDGFHQCQNDFLSGRKKVPSLVDVSSIDLLLLSTYLTPSPQSEMGVGTLHFFWTRNLSGVLDQSEPCYCGERG